MENRSLGGPAVVAHFVDGRVLKGTTHDFAPLKPIFHLTVRDDPSAKALTVPIGALKALFFVRSFEGDPKRDDVGDVDQVRGPGRKITVTFHDGETLSGLTTTYAKDKQGFFVIPADAGSNNTLVFVVMAAVMKITVANVSVRVGA